MKPFYRVNLIASKFSTERDAREYPVIEKCVGDYSTLQEAKEVFDQTRIGMEVDKELLQITEINGSEESKVIESTY